MAWLSWRHRHCAHCGECAVDTSGPRPRPRNLDYMATDEVWRRAGFVKSDIACIECLQVRLGRPLVATDFTDAVCNQMLRWALREGGRS